MTELGNYAGIIFFAIAVIGVITAVMRRRVRLLKFRKHSDQQVPSQDVPEQQRPATEGESNIDSLLDNLKRQKDETTKD